MADIRVKCFSGYCENVEIAINAWLEETSTKIEEIKICSANEGTGKSGIRSQVFCMITFKA